MPTLPVPGSTAFHFRCLTSFSLVWKDGLYTPGPGMYRNTTCRTCLEHDDDDDDDDDDDVVVVDDDDDDDVRGKKHQQIVDILINWLDVRN